MILERVPGRDSVVKAKELVTRFRIVFTGREDVKVNWPTKMAEVNISGLDDSITPSEVIKAVASRRQQRKRNIDRRDPKKNT